MNEDAARNACTDYRELLLDEAALELAPADAARLSAHVAACRACAGARVEIKKALIHTRSMYVPEPAPQYWEGFVPRLKERIRTSQQGIPLSAVERKLAEKRAAAVATPAAATVVAMAPVRRRAPYAALAGLAAAALLLLFLGPLLLGGSGAPPAPPIAGGGLDLAPLGPDLDGAELPEIDEAAAGVFAELPPDDELDALIDDLSDEDAEALSDWLAQEAS